MRPLHMIKKYTKVQKSTGKEKTFYMVKLRGTTRRGLTSKLEAIRVENELRKLSTTRKTNLRFKDIAEDYVSHLENAGLATITKLKRNYQKYVFPFFENKNMISMNNKTMRDYKEYVSGLKLHTSHKNYLLNLVKRVFKHSVIYFDNHNNPSSILTNFKKTREEIRSRLDSESEIWTTSELNIFLQKIDESGYRLFFEILFFTGLRLGEIQALKWSDFENETLFINKAYNKAKNAIGETKTISSVRYLEIGSVLAQKLELLKEKEKVKNGFSDEWFIFGGVSCYPRTTITRVKDKAIKEAKIKRIKLHGFRHSHASMLIASGNFSIVEVSKRLGHSNPNTTLGTYSHLYENKDIKIKNLLDSNVVKMWSEEK